MNDRLCNWLQWAAADRQSNRRLEEEHHEGDHQASCRLHCFFRNTPSLGRTFRRDTYWFYSGTILTDIQSRRTCTWKRGRGRLGFESSTFRPLRLLHHMPLDGYPMLQALVVPNRLVQRASCQMGLDGDAVKSTNAQCDRP